MWFFHSSTHHAMEQQPANWSWTNNLVGVIKAQYTAAASNSNDPIHNSNQPPTGAPDGDLSGRSTLDEVNGQARTGIFPGVLRLMK